MMIVEWSLVTLCFMVGVLSQLASGALGGEIRFGWGQLLGRLVFVILLLEGAGPIQGFIWKSAQSIGDSLLPGPTLWDLNVALEQKVNTMKAANAESKELTYADLTSPGKIFNVMTGAVLRGLEHLALSLFFISYKLLQSAQQVIMMFLAAMVPFVFPPSIIPGINSWSSWLKMVISVALWPVVAGFLIKGHVSTAAQWMSDPAGMARGDVHNLFINMDSLNLLTEAILYSLMLFSAPFLSSAGGMMMTGFAQRAVQGSSALVSNISRIGSGGGEASPFQRVSDRSRSAKFIPGGGK